MRARVPPRVALWLLLHLGPGYHAEALAGDLLEEYQLGRSSFWYWMQVLAAIRVSVARLLRPALARAAVRTVLRILIESAVVIGVGVGTLTWAGTGTKEPCKTPACLCQPQRSHP